MANRNRTDCTALMSGFGVKSPIRFCYLQLTDMSRLSAAKPYRGFESTSLHHAVWNAEKLTYTPRKIARNGRNSVDFALGPDWRKCPALLPRQALWPFSLEASLAVRFSTTPSGERNAIRNRRCGETRLAFFDRPASGGR